MRRLETKDKPVFIVCGTGNNGGDGLVVARLLHEKGHQVSVSQAMIGSPNEDNRTNHKRAEATGVRIQSIEKNASFPTPPINAVIIDALFGTGLSRPLEGYWASL
ncbi:MAG: NAD(P)H-hydrate epimerase, partial [Neolewinella sp.]